jgi:hypothetical protein
MGADAAAHQCGNVIEVNGAGVMMTCSQRPWRVDPTDDPPKDDPTDVSWRLEPTVDEPMLDPTVESEILEPTVDR